MTADHADGRWPFRTNGPPLAEGCYDPTAETAAGAFVRAAAEALDTDTLAVPTLYDRIDPDCVEPLVAEPRTGPPGGIRVAVEASFETVSVLLCDDGRIEVYSDGREPNRLELSTTGMHDWTGYSPLFWSVGKVVAKTSDRDSTAITRRLVEHFDQDAADRLLRPVRRSDRSDSRLLVSVDGYEIVIYPSGLIAVEPSLAVLKRPGAAVLLVGSAPEEGFDRMAASLLGEPREARPPVFVLHGRDVETVRRRLSMAGRSPREGTVIEYGTTARGASAAANEDVQSTDRGLDAVPVSGGRQPLSDAVRGAIGDGGTFAPGELRICVDSLDSMADSSDIETTRDELEPIRRTVREHRGIGSFLFHGDADSADVETLAPVFEAVVALRTGDDGLEQRWRLTGTGHETSWFPLR